MLAIVRGGAPAAIEVARALALPLDVIVMKALRVRPSGDVARAVRVAGSLVRDPDAGPGPLPHTAQDLHILDGLAELDARDAVCRGPRPVRELAGMTVLVVDNGMRTGGTMMAALRAVRTLAPARLIAAAPVAEAASIPLAATLADELVVLRCPTPFGNVGMGYRRFEVPDEPTIRALLDAHAD